LRALKDGDEAAFVELVRLYHGPLRRFARAFGVSDAVAEEVVQETWLVALNGIERFEERSSLRAWLFGILKNQARRRSQRERRTLPFSSFGGCEGDTGASVDALRFDGAGGTWPDHWSNPPRPWEDPQRRLDSLEARRYLREAIDELPERQRAVVVLRDIEGLEPAEVCGLLELTEGNQRVLLHRARAQVRTALEEYLSG